jgi:hypothetical protein
VSYSWLVVAKLLYILLGRQRTLRTLARHGNGTSQHRVGDSLSEGRAFREPRCECPHESIPGSGSVYDLDLKSWEVASQLPGSEDHARGA